MTECPDWLEADMNGVPPLLRALGWIGWRAEAGDDGRWRKPPYQLAQPSVLASNADPRHWGNEGDVREIQIMAPDLFDGFGVALIESANITCIDIDHVRDPDTGVLEPWARRLVERFKSWTEISPSGTGLHIFVRGQLPGSGI